MAKTTASQARLNRRNAVPKKDITIILLGVTGAGKSTFVSLASAKRDIKIGHGVDPCTSSSSFVSVLSNADN